MSEWKACKECGVPRVLTKEYLWLDNGDIVQARDQRDRIVFTECENLDPLFRGIEEIIATPISHVVIDCVRRTYRTYCGLFLPKNVDELVKKKRLDLKSLDDGLAALAAPMGVGRYGFVDMRCEWDDGDFYTVSVSEPNSIPMCVAAHCGAIEAIQGRDHGVRYAEKTPGVFEITEDIADRPEPSALLFWEVETDASAVTAIHDHRRYAGRTVCLRLAGAAPVSPGFVADLQVEHPLLYVDEVVFRVSDNGSGSSGSTVGEWFVDGVTAYTLSLIHI